MNSVSCASPRVKGGSRCIIGVDPSLRSTGLCYKDPDNNFITEQLGLHQCLRGPARLHWILKYIQDIHENYLIDLTIAAIEGYSMGIHGGKQVGRYFDIGELGGVLRYYFYNAGVKILVVPPKSLKMFISGNGNADKEEVQKAIKDRWGYTFGENRHDESDAFALWHYADTYMSRRKRRGWSLKSLSALDSGVLI